MDLGAYADISYFHREPSPAEEQPRTPHESYFEKESLRPGPKAERSSSLQSRFPKPVLGHSKS